MTRGFRLAAASGLHRGDRPYQQDQVMMIGHPHAKGCLMAVVADGMGGRSGGRKASDQVLMTARQLFAKYSPETDSPSKLLKQVVEDSHTVIKLTAVSAEQEPHSTVAAFVMNPRGDCTWIHVGDSRIYQFRNGRMVKRTRDHSYVQALVDRGEIAEDEMDEHPQANILLGCLGMSTTPPPIDIHAIDHLKPGDALMACSDGLWHYFTPEEMGALIAERNPRESVELLIEEARVRARGTGDNISVAILKLEPLPKGES
ncbi:MAG: serine/threonine-protein phosphatase [Proteobacteria bacterium]|nr:serine/threonine-protein phosphatase [Pseudomonadota bacterium]